MGPGPGALVVWAFLVIESAVAVTYSSRIIHRFSDEMKAFRVSAKGRDWPEKKSLEYYRMLLSGDVERQKMKLGPQSPFLFPTEGNQTKQLGNDLGWLHYTWIDIGMPSVSFLVALDCGSDLLWVPCDCSQCAPLSAGYYSILDKDLNEYSPSGSSTSKQLSCSHQLCQLGSYCKNPKEPCPYTVNYRLENVSSSGLLVEDILHLVSRKADASNSYIRTPVIIGCGKKQTGDYLNGIAPDGLMGLGLGEISVPSFLAKAGVVRNTFSLCFDEDDSGRIYFVEACCISSSCLEQTSFKALVDSGTSFTYLPNDVYERVVKEFDGRVHASKTSFEGYPWQYCYKSSSLELLKVPSVRLKFALNNSFVVRNPVFKINGSQGLVGLAIQPIDGDMGIIGQNFMTGYRMVFDRENLKLGWSRSNCEEIGDGKRMPLSPSPNSTFPNPLPTEQQSRPGGNADAPAVAGRTPSSSSARTIRLISHHLYLAKLLPLLLLLLHKLVCTS